jgi:hypothetical protein
LGSGCIVQNCISIGLHEAYCAVEEAHFRAGIQSDKNIFRFFHPLAKLGRGHEKFLKNERVVHVDEGRGELGKGPSGLEKAATKLP